MRTAMIETPGVGPSSNAWGVTLTEPVIVNLQNKLVAFAREKDTICDTIYFQVLDPGEAAENDEPPQWNGWYRYGFSQSAREVIHGQRLPNAARRELRLAGMDLLTLEAESVEASPADATFQVVVIDRYMLIFRPSTSGTLYVDQLMLSTTKVEGVDHKEESRYALSPAWEVRFQRSGVRDVPAGDTDTRGALDPAGSPFLTPTLELIGVQGAEHGHFAVARVPTENNELFSWYVAVASTQGVQLFFFEESDGLDVDLGQKPFVLPLLQPTLAGSEVALTPEELAPTLAFWAEQEPVVGNEGTPVEVQRAGRLMLAFSAGAPGLEPCMVVYDFGLTIEGRIAALPAEDQAVVLIDGTFDAASHTFTPDHDSPAFPTPEQLPATVSVVDGLMVSKVALGQVKAQRDPLLWVGEDGLLHLYHAGPNPDPEQVLDTWGALNPDLPQAMVAQFDTRTSRTLIALDWDHPTSTEQPAGAVYMISRISGPLMEGAQISVEDVAGHPDLCDLRITYPVELGWSNERWQGVPREVSAFHATVNGRATDDAADPAALSGARVFYDYNGDQPLVRLPLLRLNGLGWGGEVNDPRLNPVASFVTTRSELALGSVTFEEQGDSLQRRRATLHLGSESTPITLVWPDLPQHAGAYQDIFSGAADSGVYDYVPGPGTTLLFALETDTNALPASVLFIPKPDAGDLSEMTIAVARASAGSELLNVSFTLGENTTLVEGLPAEVHAFVEALGQNADFAALKLAINSQGAGGRVRPTSAPRPRLDLRGCATLFDLLMPELNASSVTLQSGEHSAVTQGHIYEGDFALTEMIGFYADGPTPDDGAPAFVKNTAAALKRHTTRGMLGLVEASDPAHGGRWLRKTPNIALAFESTESMSVPVHTGQDPLPRALALAPQHAWTLEGWIRPEGSAMRRLVTFHQEKDLPAGAPEADYRVNLAGADVLSFASYDKQPDTQDSSFFMSGTSENADFTPTSDFTWEFWVKPDDRPAPAGSGSHPPLGGVVQIQHPGVGELLAIGLDSGRHLVVRSQNSDFELNPDVRTPNPLPMGSDGASSWNHVAVVGRRNPTSGTWQLTVVVDGILMVESPELEFMDTAGSYMILGRNDDQGASVFGELFDVRYWGRARSISEIRAEWFRSLTGTEDALLGAWPLAALETRDGIEYVRNIARKTGEFWDCELTESSDQAVDMVPDNAKLSLIASVAGLPAQEAAGVVISGRWNHIALTLQKGGALELNPPDRFALERYDWAECTDVEFEPGLAFALDTWVVMPEPISAKATILSQWASDLSPEDQSYKLEVDTEGNLVFTVVVTQTMSGERHKVSITSSGVNMLDGKTHHVAARYRSVDASQDDDLKGVAELELYVDGVNGGSAPIQVGRDTKTLSDVTTVPVQGSTSSVTLGRAYVPPTERDFTAGQNFFRGTVGRMRFWSAWEDTRQIFSEQYPRDNMPTRPRTLTAEWNFHEQEGRVAADIISGSDFTLNTSAPWAAMRATSEVKFVINGANVGLLLKPDASPANTETAQFALGRPVDQSEQGFRGAFGRLSLWSRVMTPTELASRRFSPLVGDEVGLLAGWDFAQREGLDITGGGNNADPIPGAARFSEQPVPISNEGGAIRNVYGETVTFYHRSATGRFGVGAYAMSEQTETGPRSALHRSVMLDANSSPLEPLYLGELQLTYIGQVQTEPTLIGYIEGAPPVPSENLTRPYYLSPGGGPFMKYLDTTKVTLSRAESESISFKSSTTRSVFLDVSAQLGPYWSYELQTLKGFIIDKAISAETSVLFQGTVNWKSGREEGEGLAAQWNRTTEDTQGVTGDWEPFEPNPENYLNPEVGRRFEVSNVGYALVESLTADMYAMTYRPTGAAVGTIVLPNPAIPPDQNILIFPIRDGYTHAGSLDGRIGLVDDPRRGGDPPGRASYFKPVQAYALASRIEERAQQARAKMLEIDITTRGRTSRTDLSDVAARMPVNFDVEPAEERSIAMPAQGIVNRYVWSADGGLHAESMSYAASSSKVYSGFNQIGGGGGVAVSFQAPVVKGGFDLMAGGHVEVSMERDHTRSQGMSLNVSVDGEGYLRAWDPSGTPEYGSAPGAYREGTAPGKVHMYRFMSYYLPPERKNATDFQSIVDSEWLQLSNDPTARAMREINLDNPVWRVLHRVTYVHREPPKTASRPVTSAVDTARLPHNVEGNEDLLMLIQEQLGQNDAPTPIEVGQAVGAVINPPRVDGSYPTSVLEGIVPWWRSFLDQARPDADGKIPNKAAARQLDTLMRRVVDYCLNGYASGALPLPPTPQGGLEGRQSLHSQARTAGAPREVEGLV
ncbi:hypothetical protein DL240_18940 [Lujinxingia litoralis]|uniref:LamG-like jellyroll fold domain-containing protein n=2 Tax=Lujinxingia litoralis TaxID=2211119 RepID=A0A328C4U2_9DELT|nr:hypothetical protein DL240_18940 [Lujinxingia litoralis]